MKSAYPKITMTLKILKVEREGQRVITTLFTGALKAISDVAKHLDNRIKDLVWQDTRTYSLFFFPSCRSNRQL